MVSQKIRDSFTMLLFCFAAAPWHSLLLKQETNPMWADSSCSGNGHFTKEKFCEMGPLGMYLSASSSRQVYIIVKLVRSSSSPTSASAWRLPPGALPHDSAQNWFPARVVLQHTCCTSLSFPTQKPVAGVLQGHQFGWNWLWKVIINTASHLQEVPHIVVSRGNWKGSDFAFV